MNYKKIASVFSLLMGVSMIVIWIMFFITDGVPEVKTKPLELGMHIAAELLTALLLIIGGIGLSLNKKWSLNIYLISIGMLTYSLIMSPEYFLQNGNIHFVIMFTVFLVITITITTLVLLNNNN